MLVQILRPDGSMIAMAPGSVFRFTYVGGQRAGGTLIEYSGGLQLTPTPAEEVATLMTNAIELAVFHAAPAVPVWLNVAAVSAAKPAGSSEQGCILVVANRYQHVIESYDEVARVLNAKKRGGGTEVV